ncbi:MAG: dTDP-4-dehydrorhamnose 3,5-epimerase [Bacteroidetes bacterium]|nr:dTDP-4-dehydrorhamnose 3,5-epimerase [Bacteroidota bacterium]
MNFQNSPLTGVVVIFPKVIRDDRGYFYEAFSKQRYAAVCGDVDFVQDNVSESQKNTVRGLHYQIGEFAQGKLCKVLSGKVIDVAVDIRFGSPTFGKYFAVELSDENSAQLWIPPGFAHGFSVLSETAVFHYKCTNYYSKEHERAIRFNDPQLNIQWNVRDPLVSPKDLIAPLLSDIKRDFILG